MVGSMPPVTVFCYFLIYFHLSSAEKGIIKDSTMDFWYHRSIELSTRAGLGWTNSKTSKTESNDITNGTWLITNLVALNDTAQLIYVDCEARIRSCISNRTCYFQVFIYRGNTDPIIPVRKKERTKSYLLRTFKPVYNIRVSTLGEKETKTFKFRRNGTGLTFGIRARGVHGELSKMKLYYYYCKEMIHKGIKLVKTISPVVGYKEVKVNCSMNSSPTTNETALRTRCQNNGTWTIDNSTDCLCHKGFWPSNGCKPCPNHHYKADRSNYPCDKCPEHSTNDSSNTYCRCDEGYYRLLSERSKVVASCYALPSKVKDLRVKDTNSIGTVNLTWLESSENGGLYELLKYDVECYSCNDSSSQLKCTRMCAAIYKPGKDNLNQTHVLVSGLNPGTTYLFKVFSKNSVNKAANKKRWNYVEKTHRLKLVPLTKPAKSDINALYFIIGAVGLAMLFVILCVFLWIKRKHKTNGSQVNLTDGELSLPILGVKTYIDPYIYDDPQSALEQFVNEIDPTSLSLDQVIGGGEFGDVYKGILALSDGSKISVAVKTLKHDADEKSRKDFLSEASAMGQFDYPNVIHLEGVITKVAPAMIITEYMSNGSLDNFLKQNYQNFTNLQLIGMARGVASGMKYLAEMNFVHRDLAARNILVNENMLCKVADFGLSRELETADSSRGEYLTTGGKIPVRWTAPEAIKYRKFSTASDVWSFGILLWEVMSFAERPYWDWDNFKVMERVDAGFRLPPPMSCPKVIHELMLKCWVKNRGHRPQFYEIVKILDGWIRCTETMQEKKLQYRTSPVPEVNSSTSIKEWLDSIRMSSYIPHFSSAGYEQLSQLAGLMEDDLKEIGITLVGHRNKMLRTIRTLSITEQRRDSNERKRLKSVRI